MHSLHPVATAQWSIKPWEGVGLQISPIYDVFSALISMKYVLSGVPDALQVSAHCVKLILYVKPKMPFQFLDICFKFIR